MPNYRIDFAKEILGVPFTVGSRGDSTRARSRAGPACRGAALRPASMASATGASGPIWSSSRRAHKARASVHDSPWPWYRPCPTIVDAWVR